jgi:hypothetical protein
MLKRINAGLFEEDEDSDIELAVKAQNNNGTEDARFDYNSTVLGRDTVQGHPGCRFKVRSGTRQFKVLVAFDPAAPAAARYDLFQVNAAGTLTAVGKSVSNTGGTALIGFGIDGVPVTVPAGAAGGRRKMPKRPKRASRKAVSRRRRAKTTRKPAASSSNSTSAARRKQAKPRKRARAVKTTRPRTPKRATRGAKKSKKP